MAANKNLHFPDSIDIFISEYSGRGTAAGWRTNKTGAEDKQ
jgi:hypothetical protein